MENLNYLRGRWNALLRLKEYSVGNFFLMAQGDVVRAYNYDTRRIVYFHRKDSFKGMQQLCQEQGYDLKYLLENYSPRSILSLEI